MFDVGDRIIGLELPDTFYKLAELLELGFPLKTWLAWEEGERKPPQYIEQLILERLEKMNKS